MNSSKLFWREIVDTHESAASKAFDFLVLGMVVVALVSFTFSSTPNLSSDTIWLLEVVELICLGFFTAEYALRIWVAEDRWSYLRSFHGIVDFITIAPFYLAIGIDHEPLRALRILRIFSVLKLLRIVSARRVSLAFEIAKSELGMFLTLSIMIIYLAAVGVFYFEHAAQPSVYSSISDSLWWAVVTLTTVGYGDMYPITGGGRLFTCIILFIGLGLVAVPAGIVSSALSEARRIEREQAV